MSFWASPAGQLVVLGIGWVIIRLLHRGLRRHWPRQMITWDLFTPLLIICSVVLIPQGAGVVLPWIVMGWTVIGMGVALLQGLHNHELIYPTFFKTFWRLSDLYWLVGFVICFLLTIS